MAEDAADSNRHNGDSTILDDASSSDDDSSAEQSPMSHDKQLAAAQLGHTSFETPASAPDLRYRTSPSPSLESDYRGSNPKRQQGAQVRRFKQAVNLKNAESERVEQETHSETGGLSQGPSVENSKSFRVSMEDPCYKVLPAALKKYKIDADWRQYALYIVYGDQERLLGLEEKPLLLFKQLDREGKKPMFMIRKHAPFKGNFF